MLSVRFRSRSLVNLIGVLQAVRKAALVGEGIIFASREEDRLEKSGGSRSKYKG